MYHQVDVGSYYMSANVIGIVHTLLLYMFKLCDITHWSIALQMSITMVGCGYLGKHTYFAKHICVNIIRQLEFYYIYDSYPQARLDKYDQYN